ncbi:Hypothetical Protein FCC1311_086222 [Hondaea fermentalgiana]|uniref:Uncharacterized protein n=1 Tax=Hondaea fermentalgiana TaxID=2315210 RepID=A0A2R5GNC5_9STRA|nr:Hypothetical Protein FCC1311_086222 [Hondaea fermentalgiana]|eukprot:GBG32397.1 Hypothetical Protein FCC1311_086222 [Hondaea fermentalgiana]
MDAVHVVGVDALAAALGLGFGSSIGLNAVLSAVGFFSVHFGRSSFIWLTCALYLPSLPAALVIFGLKWVSQKDNVTSAESHNGVVDALQAGGEYDGAMKDVVGRSKKLWGDASLVMIAFVAEALGLLVIPIIYQSFASLLLVCFVLGVCSTVSLEYALQMILMLSANASEESCSKLKAAVFSGYQASSLLCLIAKLISGLDPMSHDSVVSAFFIMLALIALSLLLAVFYFARCCVARLSDYDAVPTSIPLEDNEDSHSPLMQGEPVESFDVDDSDTFSLNTTPTTTTTITTATTRTGSRADSRSSWYEAALLTRECALSLFLTIFASMLVFPFYAFVPSSEGGEAAQARLASVLFYAKTFSDAASRPATVVLPQIISSRQQLLGISALRFLVSLPLFFVYTFGHGVIPCNDTLLIIYIVLFSASSGYLKTLSFQLLPDDKGLAQQVATVMNIAFQCSLFSPLILAALVCEIFNLY